MRKVFLIILSLTMIAVALAGYAVLGPAVSNPEEKFLYIPTGADLPAVKDSLDINGFLSGFRIFDLVASRMELSGNIRPGKYKIPDRMSVYNLVKKLREGRQETVNLVITKIRVREDLAKRISRSFELDSASVMDFLSSNDSLLRFDVDTNTVLTDVFPDTYSYYWTASMGTIFNKLLVEKERFWSDERKTKAENHGLTPSDVYILASIVEEETNKQDDKGKIASVYINRLRKGMALAADPTIKYAMKDFSLTRIYHKYLDVASPYNTYRNKGLPPGPICTPSKKTIDAVLDAPETNYLFFVARQDFSGYSNFATTYNEHLIYAGAYRKALDSLVRARREKEKQTKEQ